MKIEFTEFSSLGLVRSVNQDSIFSAVKDDYGLFAVADGMGGHTDGEVASQRLIECLKKWWEDFSSEIYDFERCYADLRKVINDVHNSIYEEYTLKGNTCGTTVALVFIYSDRYIVINSGDSRIYSRDGFKIKQESKDHVFGIESVISGKMTIEEAENHPNKNKLTAAIGCKKELKFYIASAPIETDQFFICSDGVYKYCNESDISSAMRKKDIVNYISDIVNSNGASDNFSFINIRIDGGIAKKRGLYNKLILSTCAVLLMICGIAGLVSPKGGKTDDFSQTELITEETEFVLDFDMSESESDMGKDEIHNAYVSFEKGKFREAVNMFKEILEKDSDSIEANIGLAVSYLGLGDYENANDILVNYSIMLPNIFSVTSVDSYEEFPETISSIESVNNNINTEETTTEPNVLVRESTPTATSEETTVAETTATSEESIVAETTVDIASNSLFDKDDAYSKFS